MEIHQAMGRHGPLRAASSYLGREKFIVVAPQLPEGKGGDVWSSRAKDVRTILEKVTKEYHADPQRAYLTGFSYGANGVLEIASANPKLWAALWPVDPSRHVTKKVNLPTWLWFGTFQPQANTSNATGLAEVNENAALKTNQGHTRLELDHPATSHFAYTQERPYQWLLSHSQEKKSSAAT